MITPEQARKRSENFDEKIHARWESMRDVFMENIEVRILAVCYHGLTSFDIQPKEIVNDIMSRDFDLYSRFQWRQELTNLGYTVDLGTDLLNQCVWRISW